MAIIRGGHTVISASSSDADEQQDEGEQFSLDGQASYDPDPLVDGAMTYTWACTKIGVPEMQLYTTQNSTLSSTMPIMQLEFCAVYNCFAGDSLECVSDL